jgi:type I restriction enzyme, R subunit
MNDLARIRELRRQSTEAETAAWWLLRNRQVMGLKFRRQCALGPYVADFYCPEAGLVIELDGGAHSQPSQIKKDRAKDRFLSSIGLQVLRLANGLVLQDPELFRRKICDAASGGRRSPQAPSPGPLRLKKAPSGRGLQAEAASEPPSPARGEGYEVSRGVG